MIFASRHLYRALGFLIGAVFVYAGVVKALDPVQFGRDIDNYKILPWALSVGLAFFLPWLEILSGLALVAALVTRKLYLGGLTILTVLISVFLVATIAARARGLDITCGCFGHASEHWSFPQHLAVDLVIFVALLALFWRAPRAEKS